MVQRLAKGVLPPNTSLHKDAILALSKGATVFINYLAHAANTATLATGKRTIPPGAVIEALADLEFGDFGPRVEAELKKFNEVQTGKRNEYRRKVKEGKMGGGKGGEEEDGGGEEEGRAVKRVRREEEEGDDGMDEGEERGRRESGTGDPSAQLQTGYREFEPEDPDDDDDDDEDGFDAEGQGEEEEEEEEEGENDASGLQHRPRATQDGGEEEEEEEEEDDEDEYPDEGRRLSSVEREENGSLEGPGDDPGSSADEALSEDEGSD